MPLRRKGRSAPPKTCSSIERATERGQSTVEAAVLLPTVLLLMALLAQPACLLYTRMVMRSAASECARALTTARASDRAACEQLVLRRLDAVPEAAPFHVGGRDDWKVGLEYEEYAPVVTVCVSGHARALPLLGAAASLVGRRDGTEVLLEVRVSERVRPSWLGGSYESWISMWGD